MWCREKRRASATRSASREKGAGAAVKYRDAQGNSWGGRGPRPLWLRDALAAGHDLIEFVAWPSPRAVAYRQRAAGCVAIEIERRGPNVPMRIAYTLPISYGRNARRAPLICRDRVDFLRGRPTLAPEPATQGCATFLGGAAKGLLHNEEAGSELPSLGSAP